MAAAPLDHPRHDGAGHIEQPFDVGVDHLLPVLDVALVELFQAAAEAGVVDQHVDFGPLRRQRADSLLDGLAVAHIEADRVHSFCPALQCGRGYLGQFAGAAGGQQQPGSLGRKSQCRGRAYARRGSGNKDDFSLEAHAPILIKPAGSPSSGGLQQGSSRLVFAGRG